MSSRGIGARVLGVAALVLALASSALADKVYLKNGNVIEGRILSESGSEVVVEVGGMRQTLFRDMISSIERTAVSDMGPGESIARDAYQKLEAGSPLEAWKLLLQMAEAEPAAVDRHGTTIRRALRDVEAKATRDLTTNPASSLEVATTVGLPKSLELAVKAKADGADTLLSRMRRTAGTAHWRIGRDARQGGRLQDAERDLRQATRFLQPEDPEFAEANFDFGNTLAQKGGALLEARSLDEATLAFNEAQTAYRAVVDNTRADANLIRQAREAMAAVQSRGIEQITALSVTPTPTPRPITPTPTPTPTPSPTPSFVGGLLGDDISAKLSGSLAKILPSGMDSEKVLDWIGYFLAFAVGFWAIPWIILKALSSRGDMRADDWRGRVRFFGPFALVGYTFAIIKDMKGKKATNASRHRCPHCSFVLDEYATYTTLDFTRCPNCQGEITPVHTVDDYIRHLADVLVKDAERVAMGAETMNAFVSRDAMQKLNRAVITLAVRRRASDIHIEPGPNGVSVRHRIDGIMTEMTMLPHQLGPAIVSALKVAANMDISEKRKPQDGAMSLWVDDADIDIRVASSPSHAGETVTMRLLDVRSIQMETKHLGMARSTRELFEGAIREPHGLILVTGPTGSGKTTTLYVALQTLKTGDKNIISIEDPIEFRIAGINQIQVNPAAGLTFASGLRSILRQDPDIIFVGEIRDQETASIAINAAQTGHLVFSTLHTIDAAASVSRLVDLGISPRQFADALSLVVAQRLIRLMCPQCKKDVKPKRAILREIGISEDQEAEYPSVQGAGCDLCNHTGFYGRTGIFEILKPSEAMRGAFERQNLTTAEIRQMAIAHGMRSLREESLVLLRQAMTTPEEVLRVTK